MMHFTPRLHPVLGRAATEAKYAGVSSIGVEHVFLAILDEEDSIPSRVMRQLGVADAIRAGLLEILNSEAYRSPGEPPPSN